MISQREARRLRKRVAALEHIESARRRSWSQEWIGVEIARAQYQPHDVTPVTCHTANRLGHAVVVIAREDGLVRFVALPHPSEQV